MTSTPFTAPSTVASLYADAGRTQQRTGALLTAKTGGDDATATIVDFATHPTGRGCARSVAVEERSLFLSPKHSHPRLSDFHHLPLPDAGFDILVAAFCLYHSTRPSR